MEPSEITEYLDEVQLDRYLKFQHVFESDGWKLVEEWAQAQSVAASIGGANASSWDNNRIEYGKRIAYDAVANMATQFLNEFSVVAEQNKEEAEASFDVE